MEDEGLFSKMTPTNPFTLQTLAAAHISSYLSYHALPLVPPPPPPLPSAFPSRHAVAVAERTTSASLLAARAPTSIRLHVLGGRGSDCPRPLLPLASQSHSSSDHPSPDPTSPPHSLLLPPPLLVLQIEGRLKTASFMVAHMGGGLRRPHP